MKMRRWLPLMLLLPVMGCGQVVRPPQVRFPEAKVDSPLAAGKLQTAVFAGGCFWGTQSVFERVKV